MSNDASLLLSIISLAIAFPVSFYIRVRRGLVLGSGVLAKLFGIPGQIEPVEAVEQPQGSFLVRKTFHPSEATETVLAWVVHHLPYQAQFTMEMYHGREEAHMERHRLDELLGIAILVLGILLGMRMLSGR